MFSKHEYLAILDYLDGKPINRSVRRRLERTGMIGNGSVSNEAFKMLERHAPKNSWSPPKHHGCVLPPHMRQPPMAYRFPSLAAMLALACSP